MFKVSLSPQYSSNVLKLEKSGDILKINGTPYDFSILNDGDEIPADAIDNDVIVGGITKDNGFVNIRILMPYNELDAPEHIRFPQPVLLAEDGELFFNFRGEIND